MFHLAHHLRRHAVRLDERLPRQTARSRSQNDNAEEARVALDRAVPPLRNLANPTVNAITTIDRATDYDLIFQTVRPERRPGSATACRRRAPARRRRRHASGRARAPVPSAPPCAAPRPGSGWDCDRADRRQQRHEHAGGIDRDIFTYECNASVRRPLPRLDRRLHEGRERRHLAVGRRRHDRSRLRARCDHGRLPAQPERGADGLDRARHLAARRATFLLNGSASSDPEGRTLEYFWFEGSPPSAATICLHAVHPPCPGTMWQGVTYMRTFDARLPPEPTPTSTSWSATPVA